MTSTESSSGERSSQAESEAIEDMRIALVHSFYRSDAPSGENVVVLRQAAAMREAGHEVLVVARNTDEEAQSRLYGLRSALAVATGHGPDPTKELQAFRPDVVHVHNLFPNFGERWLGSWRGSLVTTLHNFRPLCANALLYRDGQVCTLCPDGDRWASVKHNCYRDSKVATLPLAIHSAGGISRNRLLRRADRIIALSERSQAAYIDAGDPTITEKMVVIPNGIEDRSAPDRGTPRHWAFVGRLTPEKGIADLIEAWPETEHLRVVGDGPLADHLGGLRQGGVSFEGRLSSEQVDAVLKSSWGLVFPSRWLETGGPPLVVAEAAMHGVPVLARAGSAGADFVERTGSGLTYQDEPELASKLRSIRDRHAELVSASRLAYTAELSLGAWLSRLESAYASAIAAHGGRA